MAQTVRKERDPNQSWKSLVHISTILNSHLDLYQLMPLIMLYSKDLLEAEASSLFLVNEEDNYLYCEVALGEKGEIIQQYARLELGEGIAGTVAKEMKTIVLEDAYSDPRFDKKWDQKSGFKTKSLACVPLFVKDKLIGTLEVLNKTGDRVFDAKDMELLSYLADHAAVAIENAKINDSLEKRIMELSLLYEFERKIVTEMNPRQLGDWILGRILDFLGSRSGSIYVLDENVLRILAARGLPKEAMDEIQVRVGEGIAGWVAQKKEKLLVQNLEEDPRYNTAFKYKFRAKSLISAPLIYQDELIGVISINDKLNGYAFNYHDLDMLEAIANRLAVTIKNARLFQAVTKNAQEQERAKKLMQQVLPRKMPKWDHCTISVRYLPFEEVSGDFYDFIQLDEDRMAVLLADVSGHGLSAAVLALMAHSIISTFETSILESPAGFMTHLNSALYNKLAGNFITAFYAVLDTKKQRIDYSNGGHVNPFFIRSGDTKPVLLESIGKLIGVIPELVYTQESIKWQPGDRIILYTDGLLEVASEDKSIRYGEQVFRKFIEDNISLKGEAFASKLVDSALRDSPTAKFEDDVSLICIDYNPKEKSKK